jgi:ketosteroid isomerase-like protein
MRSDPAGEVRQMLKAWLMAVRAKDIAGITADHAPDMVMFDVPPPAQVRGLDGYRRTWDDFFPWFAGIFDLSDLTVTAGEDVAFCHGLVRCGGTETDGRKVELQVRLTVGYRKIGGRWTVTHEHHSVPAE